MKVRCSLCGKRLEGRPTFLGGYTVVPHHRPKPRDINCPGHWRTDHQPIKEEVDA